MKKMFVPLSLALVLTGSLFTSCKSKTKATTNDTVAVDTPATTTYTAPVEVSADDALRQGVMDATKDFPGVNATVANGEITVTGDMKRTDWARLKPILDGLNPKKVNNQLTLK
ncbi:MAG TPA: hypothetical protein VEY06_11365 [Flavisolibacter sp.]|nr:hypothetical protein [Flavisolibacter sp.]